MKKIILLVLASSVLILILLGIFMMFGWSKFTGGAPTDQGALQNNGDEAEVVVASSPVFVAVHMEAGAQTSDLQYQKTLWPSLVGLVAAADKYGVKLTLEFNPQWAEYILQDDMKLAKVRGWEASGHEIALHHHGPSHADWNGYTNREGKKNDPKYKGTVADMMALLKQLPASGEIVTAGATDEKVDWPEGVLYRTYGGIWDGTSSKPQKATYNGVEVVELRERQYATGVDIALTLDEVKSALNILQDGYAMGLVFHEKDYKDRVADIEKLFSFLKEKGVADKTVKQILGGVRTVGGEIDSETAVVNPLNVFYVMHVEPNYGTESEMSALPRASYDEIKNTVLKVAETLEKHGMKGNFEVVYRVAKDAEIYEGKNNFIKQLKDRGHLVGLHSHNWMFVQNQAKCDSLCDRCVDGTPEEAKKQNACSVYEGSVEDNSALLKKILGVDYVSTMAFRSVTFGYEFARAADLGAKIINDNYSPTDEFASWSRQCADFGSGENTAYEETGNLMHPWRPNYQKGLKDIFGGDKDLCSNDPNGKIVYIDQVVGDWITESTGGGSANRHTLGDADFDILRKYFSGAMRNLSAKQINVWGWPQHENEYRTNLDGDYDQKSIDALDKFLTELYGYKEKGYIKYAMLEEIYDRYVAWERAQ